MRACFSGVLTMALAACASTPSAPAVPTTGSVAATTGDLNALPLRHPDGESAAAWFANGARSAAARGAGRSHARNLILFVGDGMSLPTVAAARILEGQRGGASGEEHLLAWEHFPATGFSKTYNTNAQTPDSAGTMTAMATGVKTRAGVLSVDQSAPRGDCTAARKASLRTLWELAADSGLATGVVTTTRITHATPAATFTHSADRNWESDADLPDAARQAGCRDIARQLVDPDGGKGADVLLGGGRAQFLPDTQTDPEYPDKTGKRRDGRNLVARWQERHPDGQYVWSAVQLHQQANGSGPLLGLFEPGHLQFEHDRPRDRAGEPSLAEMTRAAIARLSKHGNGYVLLVEAGRIDHAHHMGNAYRALADTIALSDAVRMADRMTGDDTLILVTADHSHTMTFAGYPTRGNPILGKVKGSSGEDGDPDQYALDGLGLPYTTLGYANGPGYAGASASQPQGPKHAPHDGKGFRMSTGRPDLRDVDTEHPDYLQESTLPMSNESHGGDDVGVWARGPGSQAVRGTMEQNVLFHILLQAQPRLRQAACDAGRCTDGIPMEPLPAHAPGSP